LNLAPREEEGYPLTVVRMGRLLRSQAGFSLVEMLVVYGLLGMFLLVTAQTLASNVAQLRSLNDVLALQNIDTKLKAAFSEVSGDQVLWVQLWGPPMTWDTPVDLTQGTKPFFNRSTLQCVSLLDPNPSPKTATPISVDALMGGGEPIVIVGSSLKEAPSLRVQYVRLYLIGDETGACPDIPSCRFEGACVFKMMLGVRRQLDPEGPSTLYRDIPYFLSCRTRERPGNPTVQEEISHCQMLVAPSPSPSPRPSVCPGDVNQDGRTDELDLKYVEAFWGQVPKPSDVAGLGLSWTGVSGPDAEPMSLRWEAAGSWPSPVPAPSPYPTAYFGQVIAAFKKADISLNDNYVDGADLGVVAADLGCVARESPVCFEDTAFYPIYKRLQSAAEPYDKLDDLDVAFLHYCSQRAQADVAVCLGLNLDGQCSRRLNVLPTPLGHYCRPDLPSPGGSQGDQQRLADHVVIGAKDLTIAKYLGQMAGNISRYRQTKPGTSGTACAISQAPSGPDN